jgi:hypothetical protein
MDFFGVFVPGDAKCLNEAFIAHLTP